MKAGRLGKKGSFEGGFDIPLGLVLGRLRVGVDMITCGSRAQAALKGDREFL